MPLDENIFTVKTNAEGEPLNDLERIMLAVGVLHQAVARIEQKQNLILDDLERRMIGNTYK